MNEVFLCVGYALGHTCGVRVDGPLARGFLRFLSLTAFQAEGCGSALRAQIIKSRPASSVISTEAKRSGEISLLNSPGSIGAGDLSTQSIIGAVTVCLSYRHAASLDMTKEPCHPTVMLKRRGRGWRRGLWPSGCRKKEAPHFEELLFISEAIRMHNSGIRSRNYCRNHLLCS